MRASVKAALVAAAVLGLAVGGVGRSGAGATPAPATPVAHVMHGDSGDHRAWTSFDGPMVRKRAAIGIHPAKDADRAKLIRQLRASARDAGLGELTEATFAVFDAELLAYLVPEITLVLGEDVPVMDAEALMRDHQPAGAAFYLVRPVLVHDLTFAAIPADGVTPEQVRERVDAEGILSDALNRYATTVQPAGVTVRYFGAILSDARIAMVRDALGGAARVPADRVRVEANHAGPGIDMSHGGPDLADEAGVSGH